MRTAIIGGGAAGFFPASQDSQTIIDCFLREAERHQVHIRTDVRISALDELRDYDYVAVCTGDFNCQAVWTTAYAVATATSAL